MKPGVPLGTMIVEISLRPSEDPVTAVTVTNQTVDTGGDPNTQYTIEQPTEPTTGPAQIPLPGFSIGGSQTWGQARYDARITGRNTAYNTSMTIEAGLGHGPVEMGTMSR